MNRRIGSPTGGTPRGPVVGIVGLGYVGLATALAFVEYGRTVSGVDISAARREELRAGVCSIHEPGLSELLRRSLRSGRFRVEDALAPVAESADLLFICVPTPSRADGSVNLDYVRDAARGVGRALPRDSRWRGVVLKSTAVPGTTLEVVKPEVLEASGRRAGVELGVAANPEFLAEGQLVHDALHPSRIVLGTEDALTERALRRAYRGFPGPRVGLSPTGAELAKYASNALLATKVSFANEIARVASSVGVDVDPVLHAVGLDPRLGERFLRPGPGFGGSCFGKDLRALAAFAESRGIALEIPRSVLAVNAEQARHVVELAARAVGSLKEMRVALLGLAFKPETNDTRDSQAYPILYELLRRGATVRLHDPVALAPFRAGIEARVLESSGDRIAWTESLEEALRGADLAILHDDWQEYRRAPAALWGSLRRRVVVDARRTLDAARLAREGVRYVSVGR